MHPETLTKGTKYRFKVRGHKGIVTTGAGVFDGLSVDLADSVIWMWFLMDGVNRVPYDCGPNVFDIEEVK